MVSRAGLEPFNSVENRQVIDSAMRRVLPIRTLRESGTLIAPPKFVGGFENGTEHNHWQGAESTLSELQQSNPRGTDYHHCHRGPEELILEPLKGVELRVVRVPVVEVETIPMKGDAADNPSGNATDPDVKRPYWSHR